MLLALHMDNKDLITLLIDNGTDINTPSVDVRKSIIGIMKTLTIFELCKLNIPANM